METETLDNYIFRYRAYTEKSIHALSQDILYFSTPDRFNDPFDSLFYVNVDKLLFNINDELNTKMDLFLDELSNAHPYPFVDYITTFTKKKMYDVTMREIFNSIFVLHSHLSAVLDENKYNTSRRPKQRINADLSRDMEWCSQKIYIIFSHPKKVPLDEVARAFRTFSRGKNEISKNANLVNVDPTNISKATSAAMVLPPNYLHK